MAALLPDWSAEKLRIYRVALAEPVVHLIPLIQQVQNARNHLVN